MPEHKTRNISLNKLASKHDLLMKLGQFMSYYKTNIFIKKFYKYCCLKTGFRPLY